MLLVTSLLVMGYVAAHSSEESKSALFVVALAAMTTLGVDLTELSIGCLSMVWAYYCTVLQTRFRGTRFKKTLGHLWGAPLIAGGGAPPMSSLRLYSTLNLC